VSMAVLRAVGVMSVAKVSAVLMAIAGLIEGILFAGLGTMIGSLAEGTPMAALGAFGVTAVVMFPIGGAISGFIGGAISAILYNLVAGKIGGIEMDLIGMQAGIPSAPAQISTATRFCASCGARIPANVKFCGICGANQGQN
jgi:hypothetical protein